MPAAGMDTEFGEKQTENQAGSPFHIEHILQRKHSTTGEMLQEGSRPVADTTAAEKTEKIGKMEVEGAGEESGKFTETAGEESGKFTEACENDKGILPKEWLQEPQFSAVCEVCGREGVDVHSCDMCGANGTNSQKSVAYYIYYVKAL
jgi:hypothetical protein